MRHIEKREPEFFKKFLQNNKLNTWKELISTGIGENIRTYILSGLTPDDENLPPEQNYQCAYTELRLEPGGDASHIDHFYKQSLYPAHIFDWNNLFVCDNNEKYGAKYKDKSIKRPEDYDYLINPVKEDPTKYFNYTLVGRIEEKIKDKHSEAYQKAKKTKDVFNLNARSLAERRKVTALTVCYCIKSGYTLDDIQKEESQFDTFITQIFYEMQSINIEEEYDCKK